jgi:hypothetical protein
MGNELRQGSAEWLDLHVGRPTVSNLSRILTPSRLSYSKSARGFASELIGERMLGKSLDEYDEERFGFTTKWMGRGTWLEEEARMWYEFYRDVEVEQVGFVETDDGRFGGSPDGLVGDDGIIEIKCRSAKAHMKCITGVEEIADRLQTQGYLWLTGRTWIDVIAYNPELPKRIVRQVPEPEVQEMIGAHLERFFKEMDLAERRLLEAGDVIEDSEEVEWNLGGDDAA